jgi:hypothetical protein
MQFNPSEQNYRAHLQQQLSVARRTLLGVVVMTVINLVLLLTNGGTYLVFSASVPYYLTFLGKVIDNGFGALVKNGTYTATGLVLGLILLSVYLLPWFLSKKRGNWLYLGAGLLCLDLLALAAVSLLLFESITGTVLDILVHIVAIVQIGKGAKAYQTLKDLPPETTYTVITDDL